jgi:hypothetical protein
VAGMQIGWEQLLDKLATLVRRPDAAARKKGC